jgi:hypothetical protein
MIRNLIDKVAKGDWSPHEPIQQSVYIDSEPQIRMIPFDKYVSQCCQKEQVDPLSVYHLMQRKIYGDMADRANRSQIFRGNLNQLLCDWEGNCTLTDMFEDPLQSPFEYQSFQTDKQRAHSLKQQIQEYEDALNDTSPQTLKDALLQTKEGCVDCMDRMKTHQDKLASDMDSYEPNYPDTWGNLAMKDDSFYRQTVKDNSDPRYQEFAKRQIDRVIPPQIQKVFMNATLLPILMKKENREISREIMSLYQSIHEDVKKIDYLLDKLPEVTEETKTSLLSQLLSGIGISDEPEESSDEHVSSTDIANTVQDIMDQEEDTKEDAEEDTDDDMDEDDLTENQEGGKMFHLGFF